MTPQNDLAHRLIRRAARSAPPALAERLEEEWSADLAARTGTLSRLRLAIGCWWATGVIMREFVVPQLATSSVGGNVRALLGDARYDFPLLSRRTIAFLAIVGVHALLIYGFASGFAQHVFPSLPVTTRAVVIEETRPVPPVPRIPTIDVKLPPIDKLVLDVPQTDIKLPPQDTPGPEAKPGPGGTDAVPEHPPVIQRLVGGPGKDFPNADDFYPPISRRLGETGAPTVQVCVDPEGQLTSDPVIRTSSGIRRLDESALSLAKAGSGHYRPTTENGKPVSFCYPYRIRFRLND
jgi:TonB family protein